MTTLPAIPTMLWHAMPPELNTSRLRAGAGPAPMLQAAAGWEAFSVMLETQADELMSSLSALTGAWSGTAGERAVQATMPMVQWLRTVSMQALKRSLQAAAQAASYTTALAITPPLPEIELNHVTHAVLEGTNFMGVNAVPIGLNEADYFIRMWNQAAGAMDGYQIETTLNTTFEPVEPDTPAANRAEGQAERARHDSQQNPVMQQGVQMAMQMGSQLGTSLIQLPQQTTQMVAQPMQQLMAPLQQMTSMFGGSGADRAQLGLIGASPLSNHPMVGGAGPSSGAGLVRAASLPGAGGTMARTPMMANLVGDTAPAAPSPGAAAGANTAGLAPVGAGGGGNPAMMGHNAKSGGARAGLQSPTLLPYDLDEEEGDDW